MKKSSCRILVIKPSSLGDIVQTLQVIEGACHALKAKKINPIVHWIVRDCFADIIRLSPFIQRCFLFKRHGGVRAFIQLMRQVRAQSYDYVLDFQGLLRSGLMTFFAHGTHKVGREDAREGSRWFYRQRFYPAKENPHAVEILQSLFQALNVNPTPQRPLTLKEVSLPQVLQGKSYVAIFPNSRRPSKEWPYFKDFVRQLLKQTQYFCVCLGSEESFQLKHERFIQLAQKTSLRELPTIIQAAQCVVANDSGPLHLAAAFHKPLVGIYGPTDFNRYGPYPIQDPKHGIFQAPQGDLKGIATPAVLKTTLRLLNKFAEAYTS